MKLSTFLAVCTTASSLAAAVPLEQRDIVMVTITDVVMTTIDVTKTIWVDGSSSEPTLAPGVAPGPSAAAAPKPEHHRHEHHKHAHPKPSTQAVPTHAPLPATAPQPPSPGAKKPKKHKPAPKPAPAPVPTPTPVASPTPAPSPSSTTPGASSGMAATGTSYVGDITYYQTGLGACGWTSGYYDHIVAVSHIVYDAYSVGSNPNDNPLCGRMVNINYGGKTFAAKVVDRCTGCAVGDLDLSEGFFSDVTNGDTAAGRIGGVHWTWM